MDIYAHLKKDHDEVKGMFQKLMMGGRSASQKKVFSKLNEELSMHIKLEEKHLYSAMLQHKTLKDMALKGHEEHEIVKKLLRDLSRSGQDEKWMAKFHVMEELVQMHLKEEEKQMFKMAKQILGRQKSEELGEKYDAEHNRMQKAA